MTVILSMALVSSNVIKQGSKIRLSEGMDTKDNNESKDEEKNTKKTEEGVEDKKKSIDSTTPTPIDTKKNDLPELNVIEKKYKELLVLQDTILGNINALEDSLGSAEKLVQSMTRTVSPL
jgi:PHD/YefM family antitoxin component YafN of YafNO toxin-antitoxin module